MIKCPFPNCKSGSVPVDAKNVVEHMIVTKDNDNHFHIHAPIQNKSLIQDFVVYILKEANIAYSFASGPPSGEEKVQEAKEKD